MGHGMRILFEVDNLAMASPATVSRCGMVYMVGYHTLIIVIIGRKCVVSQDIFLRCILATLWDWLKYKGRDRAPSGRGWGGGGLRRVQIS